MPNFSSTFLHWCTSGFSCHRQSLVWRNWHFFPSKIPLVIEFRTSLLQEGKAVWIRNIRVISVGMKCLFLSCIQLWAYSTSLGPQDRLAVLGRIELQKAFCELEQKRQNFLWKEVTTNFNLQHTERDWKADIICWNLKKWFTLFHLSTKKNESLWFWW